MKVLDKLYKEVSLKRVLIATGIFTFFIVVVLPVMSMLTTKWIGVADSPDTMLGASIDKYLEVREQYGEEGRNIYIILRYTFDIIWPMVYLYFFVSVISFFDLKRVKKYGRALLLIPILGTLFDLLENISATIFMASYPNEARFFIHALYYSSTIKWIFMILSITLILQLVLQYVFQREKYYVTEQETEV